MGQGQSVADEELLWHLFPMAAKKSLRVGVALIDKVADGKPMDWNVVPMVDGIEKDLSLRGMLCSSVWKAITMGENIDFLWEKLNRWSTEDWRLQKEEMEKLLYRKKDDGLNLAINTYAGAGVKVEKINQQDAIKWLQIFGLDEHRQGKHLVLDWALQKDALFLAEHMLKKGANPNAMLNAWTESGEMVCEPQKGKSPKYATLASSLRSIEGYLLFQRYGWEDPSIQQFDPLLMVENATRYKKDEKTEALLQQWRSDRQEKWTNGNVLSENFCTYLSALKKKSDFKNAFEKLDVLAAKDVKGRGLMAILVDDCWNVFAEALSAVGKINAKKLFAQESKVILPKLLSTNMLGFFSDTSDMRRDGVKDPWEVTMGVASLDQLQEAYKNEVRERAQKKWSEWGKWSESRAISKIQQDLHISMLDVMRLLSNDEPQFFQNVIETKIQNGKSINHTVVSLGQNKNEEHGVKECNDIALLWMQSFGAQKDLCEERIVELGGVDFLRKVTKYMLDNRKANGLEEGRWQKETIESLQKTSMKLERGALMDTLAGQAEQKPKARSAL